MVQVLAQVFVLCPRARQEADKKVPVNYSQQRAFKVEYPAIDYHCIPGEQQAPKGLNWTLKRSRKNTVFYTGSLLNWLAGGKEICPYFSSETNLHKYICRQWVSTWICCKPYFPNVLSRTHSRRVQNEKKKETKRKCYPQKTDRIQGLFKRP